MKILIVIFLVLISSLVQAEKSLVPGGNYRALFARPSDAAETIHDFYLDITPVTNAQFAQFIMRSPKWQKAHIALVFADSNYLLHWAQDIDATALQDNHQPVVNVSWFAAQAYCRAQGGRLPKTSEWEWAALSGQAKQTPELKQKILDWYAKPNNARLPDVQQSPANAFGLFDLYGLVWEWTEDFNGVMSSGESRNDSAIDNQFFCGSAAAGSADPGDYATFMRFALRASLSAKYTLPNLGFRCAYDGSSP